MSMEILYCSKCHAYTLKEFCPECASKSLSPKPARFSIEDRYGLWRRKAKKEASLA